jgi:hypothetical protein
MQKNPKQNEIDRKAVQMIKSNYKSNMKVRDQVAVDKYKAKLRKQIEALKGGRPYPECCVVNIDDVLALLNKGRPKGSKKEAENGKARRTVG